MQLEAIASHPIARYLGEETNTCLTATSFQVVVESSEVPPQPPLLQTKQPQFPQPFLVRLLLCWRKASNTKPSLVQRETAAAHLVSGGHVPLPSSGCRRVLPKMEP